ncbi:hypothetical protein AB0442_21915 [Kitasatospora sp. NPDC085895]|uniref:hypothetical protein n=1 Tax=Kitasatospora sp. NPDC085895 TaxID=3155057 RepID=UPI00344EC10B
MKKRSMLAFASLAVGVVASLTAPSAHADGPQHRTGDARTVTGTELPDTAAAEEAAEDADLA